MSNELPKLDRGYTDGLGSFIIFANGLCYHADRVDEVIAAKDAEIERLNALACNIGAKFINGEWHLPFYLYDEPHQMLPWQECIEKRSKAAAELADARKVIERLCDEIDNHSADLVNNYGMLIPACLAEAANDGRSAVAQPAKGGE